MITRILLIGLVCSIFACSNEKDIYQLNHIEFNAKPATVQDSLLKAERLLMKLPEAETRNFFIDIHDSLVVNNLVIGHVQDSKLQEALKTHVMLQIYSDKEIVRLFQLIKYLRDNDVDGAYEDFRLNRFVFPYREEQADGESEYSRDIMLVHHEKDTLNEDFRRGNRILDRYGKMVLTGYIRDTTLIK